MRHFVTFLVLSVLALPAAAQTSFLNEDFNYPAGNLVGQGSWFQIGAPSGNPIQIISPTQPLTYTGYSTTGGNLMQLSSSGQGAYKNFTSVFKSGSVYTSFLMQVVSAPATGNYSINLTNVPNTSTGNFALMYVKASGAGFQIGLTKSRVGAAVVYNNTVFNLNTTYLVVLKYTIYPGALNNDSAALYIFTTGFPATEPATADILPVGNATANSDTDSLTSLTLRQGNPAPNIQVDAIRVSGTWPAVSALPVTLMSFNAVAHNQATELSWVTAGEQGIQSFGVERSTDGTTYESVCTIAPRQTAGATGYTATDAAPAAGLNYYRLNIRSLTGTSRYSSVVKVLQQPEQPVTLRPNPVSAGAAILGHPAAAAACIRILDGSGKVLQTIAPVPGSTQTPIFLDGVPAGLYHAVYRDGSLQQSLPLQKN